MAGAGYKVWSPGEVVTAANVGNYLQDQVTGVYASAAARTTALGTAVSAGMLSYRTDDKALELYAGSAWQPVIQGKNALINGAFEINQRSFISTTSSSIYGFDRWFTRTSGDGTATFSAQSFTTGSRPVGGWESANYARLVTSGFTSALTLVGWRQNIENVRTFAGKTVTISFWARAASGTPKVGLQIYQQFGSGGSAAVNVNFGSVTLSTNWARYTGTAVMPEITGKTIGVNDALGVSLYTCIGSSFNDPTAIPQDVGLQAATVDFWGVQVEEGSVATPFSRGADTLQGELAACQRYYWRTTSGTDGFLMSGTGSASSTTNVTMLFTPPVNLRTSVSAIDYSLAGVTDHVTSISSSTLVVVSSQPNAIKVNFTVSGATQYRPYLAQQYGVGSGFIGFSAEL